MMNLVALTVTEVKVLEHADVKGAIAIELQWLSPVGRLGNGSGQCLTSEDRSSKQDGVTHVG